MIDPKGAMQEAHQIRIVIVDDHAMVRKGLVSFLKNKPDIEVVGEARTVRRR